MNELLALHLAKEERVEQIVDYRGALLEGTEVSILMEFMAGEKKNVQVLHSGFRWVARLSLKKFKPLFRLVTSAKQFAYVIRVLRLTNGFHVAVRLFSNISQMTSKCGKDKTVAHEGIAECVTDVLTTFWRLLWSVAEQTPNNMESLWFI